MDIPKVRKEELAFAVGYRVSDAGEVISPRGTVRKCTKNQDGYKRFTFKAEGSRRSECVVHRLAAFQWFGTKLFAEGMTVRHLNSIRDDNRKVNIAIGSRAENEADKPLATRQRTAMLGARAQRKLTYEQVCDIRAAHERGVSGKVLCAQYGVAKGTISYIVNGKTYLQV